MPSRTAEDRTAVLLRLLGDEVAESVLARLRPDRAAAVRRRVSGLAEQPPSLREQKEVLEDFDRFYRFARRNGGRAFRLVVGDDAEEGDPGTVRHKSRWRPFTLSDAPAEDLLKLTIHQVAGVLEKEHPRTAALVLGVLPTSRAAQILALFPEELRKSVVVAMGQETAENPLLVRQIISALVLKGMKLPPEPTPRPDRIRRLAELFRSVDKKQRSQMLAALEAEDAETAAQVVDQLYVFGDLSQLDGRTLQRILSEVDTRTLAQALHGAASELVSHVTGNLSKRARESLSEEMQFQQDVTEELIEHSRKSITTILARLEQG